MLVKFIWEFRTTRIDICELGIAITKKKELLMNGKTIRKELDVDSLVFLKQQI